jgi:hypothetical protein
MENPMNMLLEAYDLAELEIMNEEYDAFIFEAQKKRPFAEYKAEADKKLKDQIVKYNELIKKNPAKADVYKAQLDVVNAKATVLKMKEKLDAVKKKA